MKEWLRRALRTFGQAAIGWLAANLVAYLSGMDFNDTEAVKSAAIGLATAAIAAGVAAVMNLPKKEEE